MNPSSNSSDLIIRGKRVITPQAERPASIHIRDGIIIAVSDFADVPANSVIYEAGDSAVMPGLVDTHVHINEPGRTEWEGFSTATRAAAAGGITTLIEMPLNSIPATITADAFQEKLHAANNKLYVDTGFWGGVVPHNAAELAALWQAGCFGFKCFLIDSGVPEFAHVTESDLREALPHLAKLGAPLLAHAELPGPLDVALKLLSPDAAPHSYNTWLTSRPRAAENEAIALLIRLANEFAARVHIVHLSSTDALPQIRQARSQGIQLTIETCPHYLTFAAEEIPDGATQFKCAPPIRERENREKLWAALRDGTIDMIVTDHSPCPPEMKQQASGDFLHAWGGIASLQLSLPAVWTEARPRGCTLSDIARWMCQRPAQLAGLANQKGAIAPGHDADLVIWNPESSFHVDPAQLYHRHKLALYAQRSLLGTIEATFLRAIKIFDRGGINGSPTGRILLRGTR